MLLLICLTVMFSTSFLHAEEDLRDFTQKQRDVLNEQQQIKSAAEHAPNILNSDEDEKVVLKEQPEKKEVGETNSKAEKISIKDVHVELSEVNFGQVFTLKASFEREIGERFLLPGSIPSTDKLQMIGEPVHKTSKIEGQTNRVLEEIIIKFLPMDITELKTPEIILHSEQNHQLRIPEQVLNLEEKVEAVAPSQQPSQVPATTQAAEEPKFMAGKAFYSFKIEDLRYRYALYTLLFLLLFVLIYRWLKKYNFFRELFSRKNMTEVTVAAIVPKRPAGEVALERLDDLLATNLLTESKIMEFVSRLMNVVLRPYLEDRFSLHAPQQTTAELCMDLLKTVHQGLSVQSIKGILEQTDLIKFAKADASVELAHEMAQKIRRLILDTQEKTTVENNEEEH